LRKITVNNLSETLVSTQQADRKFCDKFWVFLLCCNRYTATFTW